MPKYSKQEIKLTDAAAEHLAVDGDDLREMLYTADIEKKKIGYVARTLKLKRISENFEHDEVEQILCACAHYYYSIGQIRICGQFAAIIFVILSILIPDENELMDTAYSKYPEYSKVLMRYKYIVNVITKPDITFTDTATARVECNANSNGTKYSSRM